MSYKPQIQNMISTVNSTTLTPMTSGQTWTGTAEDVTKYGRAGISVYTPFGEATDGTLWVEVSRDGTEWSTIPRTFSDTSTAQPHMWAIVEKYFRVRYVNGSSSATTFQIQTQYSVNDDILLSHPLNEVPLPEHEALQVKSVNWGTDPNDIYVPQSNDGYVTASVSTTPLGTGGTFTTGIMDVSKYTQVIVEMTSDVDGTLVGEWYSDSSGTDLVRTFTRPFSSTEEHALLAAPLFAPYLKYTYTNNNLSAQTDFYIATKLTTKSISGQLLGLTDFIPQNVVANLGRNVIVGQTSNGNFTNVPVTAEGHLEVELHGPRLPFGSIHTEKLTPVFQLDGVYGINQKTMRSDTSNGGSAYTENSAFVVENGTSLYAAATLQSKARLRYRPGQGVVGRYTAVFDTPSTFSYQVAGFGHPEDGVYFGYKSLSVDTPEFGILYVERGVREIQTLTLTAAAAESITLNVGNDAFGSPVSGTTTLTSTNLNRAAYEISQMDIPGWDLYPSGDTVVFLAGSAGNKGGTFSLVASTTSGTFAETRAGASPTETFIPQSEWNGDVMDGSGSASNPSGVLLDPAKGNVYEIGIQYLGYGPITFKIETGGGGNNYDFVTVHTLKFPNTRTKTSFGNPSFPFTMATYSAGSTASLKLQVASIAGFIEGDIKTTANRFTYSNGRAAYITNVGGAYKPFFTIKNALVHNGVASQIVVSLLGISVGCEDGGSMATTYIIQNGDLVGNPVFTEYSDTSATLIDTSATEVSFDNNNQVLYSLPSSKNGQAFIEFESPIELQPGDTITVAGTAGTAVIDYMLVSLNTREDQ